MLISAYALATRSPMPGSRIAYAARRFLRDARYSHCVCYYQALKVTCVLLRDKPPHPFDMALQVVELRYLPRRVLRAVRY
eukprot:3436789-Rhodomonas_salina.1